MPVGLSTSKFCSVKKLLIFTMFIARVGLSSIGGPIEGATVV